MPADVEEQTDGRPGEVVLRERAAQGARRRGGAAEPVLGVDTEVLLDGRLFGKPRDEARRAAIWSALSGRTHEVFSGLALLDDGGERSGVARTAVTFRDARRRS